MRAREIIEKLRQVDPEARVVVNWGLNGRANGKEVRKVRLFVGVHGIGTGRDVEWEEWSEFANDDPEYYSGPEVVVDITSATW